MNPLRIKASVLLAIGFALLAAGCHRSSAPPPPMAIEELPGAFQKAFSKAQADAKESANEVIAAVQTKDYAKAYAVLQNLLAQAGLTPEQRSVTARGLLAVNSALRSAQAHGDATAAETLRQIRQNR
jgi:hypothetical protein